jgi:hypothetical protein
MTRASRAAQRKYRVGCRGEHEVSQNGSFLTDVAGPRYYCWPTGPGSLIGAP